MTYSTAHDAFDAPLLGSLNELVLKLLKLGRAFLLERLLVRTFDLFLVDTSASQQPAQLECGCKESDEGGKVDIVGQGLEDELGSSVQCAVAGQFALREPPAALETSAGTGLTGAIYDSPGDTTTQDETIRAKNPDVVLAFDDPLGDSDLVFALLGSIWITVLCKVLADALIGEAARVSLIMNHKQLTPCTPL